MADHVVLKRLTLNSDLGWFKSVFDGHGLRTKQKAITLNKEVMNAIWPSLLTRQHAYDAAKVAISAARALGPAGKVIANAERAKAKAVGTIPVHVELRGPGGKPALNMDRIIALQDKNWRLNGDFIIAPESDPGRFYPVMQEGDLAVIETLGSDGRRRKFENQIDVVDIGLRLTDIKELRLEFEPVETSGDQGQESRHARGARRDRTRNPAAASWARRIDFLGALLFSSVSRYVMSCRDLCSRR